MSTRPRVRTDAGYFAAGIAWAAVRNGCDFSIGVVRNPAVWKAVAAVPESAWRPAAGMKDAQVAVTGYAPAGWPPGTRAVVRRVKVSAGRISADPRSRRRRTIPKGQLSLALEGLCDHAYAYSLIATNLPPVHPHPGRGAGGVAPRADQCRGSYPRCQPRRRAAPPALR